jgi:hypothetical protein
MQFTIGMLTVSLSTSTIHANDFTFYEHLNEVIQKEPLDMLGPETRALLASTGERLLGCDALRPPNPP